jgi:glycosyltransferase involved in cell wall biosynthesis
MIRIAVFDVTADSFGALTILKEFYSHVCERDGENVEWSFIVSSGVLEKGRNANVKVVRCPNAKRSLVSRIAFEVLTVPSLLRRLRVDAILSMQNLAALAARIPQVLYVHQSLPYAHPRFSYLRRDERNLALYADIYRMLLHLSTRCARFVVVQSRWLRDAMIAQHGLHPARVRQCFPEVHFSPRADRAPHEPNWFFYPATAFVYKNFDTVLDAVRLLRRTGLIPKVHLTISGSENWYSRVFRQRVSRAGCSGSFVFLGQLSHEEVLSMYDRATVLFASRVESFGLPLLEARAAGAAIIASDTSFCREILDGYPAAEYFATLDSGSLSRCMRQAMIEPRGPAMTETYPAQTGSWGKNGTVGWSVLANLVIKVAEEYHRGRPEETGNGL